MFYPLKLQKNKKLVARLTIHCEHGGLRPRDLVDAVGREADDAAGVPAVGEVDLEGGGLVGGVHLDLPPVGPGVDAAGPVGQVPLDRVLRERVGGHLAAELGHLGLHHRHGRGHGEDSGRKSMRKKTI